MAEFPHPDPIALTHFIVSDGVERSRRFYTEVLGGETVRSGEPTIVAVAGTLGHHQRRRRTHRRQAGGDPRDAARPGSREQLPQHLRGRYPGGVHTVERTWRSVPYAADRA
jgi:catechol 2,3-dioxygenase-like lactoylglutathione lyase family enzyme